LPAISPVLTTQTTPISALAHTTTLALVRIAAEIIGASLPVYVLRISNTLQRRRKEQARMAGFQVSSEG
jgi:hypothetical protein